MEKRSDNRFSNVETEFKRLLHTYTSIPGVSFSQRTDWLKIKLFMVDHINLRDIVHNFHRILEEKI